MGTKEKLVLAILGLSLFLCWFSRQGTSLGVTPTPTRTMAEGVIELAKIYRTPTGDSLMVNLAWFDIENERWAAKPRDSDWDWLVTLHFTLNGKSQVAMWAYRVDSKELAPLDEVARFLFHNP